MAHVDRAYVGESRIYKRKEKKLSIPIHLWQEIEAYLQPGLFKL